MALTVDRRELRTDRIERRTRALGRAIFAQLDRGPSLWDPAGWDDALMGLTLADPRLKVQLFRFIDVLPMLTTPGSVRRHLLEYLEEAGKEHRPWWLRLPLALAPPGRLGDRLVAGLARRGAMHMAERFIAGDTPSSALETVQALRRRRVAFTADLLGEAIITEAEADAYQRTCLDLIRSLAGPLARAPEIPQIDRDGDGPIPRVNLSLKLSSLTPHFDALYAEATAERVLGRLRSILRAARAVGAYVHVDMEQYAYKDLTYDLFRTVLSEPEFRDWPDAGIVAQAYLPETEEDLRMLLDWVERRGVPVTVRLVKGAYWDYEVLHAGQVGWPVPVFREKWQADACFERCSRFLLEHRNWLRPAFGSHNIRSLAHAMAVAEALDVPPDGYEVQMLYGMAEAIQDALVAMGRRVRVYTPYGAMLPGMAYLVRRLLENTSNESFLKASSATRAEPDELLRNPEEVGAMWGRNRRSSDHRPAREGLPPFRNEPPTDFSKEANRDAMREALAAVEGRLGRTYSPIVAGRERRGLSRRFDSTDPGRSSVVVGTVEYGLSGPEFDPGRDADEAVSAARRAADDWADTPAADRAAVLVRAAEIMRNRRLELAAWEVFECGKPWREADADVAEAIDFCEFYAREMIRLATPLNRDVPGETNRVEHLPRGVAVVIPPWNFPLAIPTGMTVAALVTGNAVVLKPSEESPIIAWHLAQVLGQAGLPPGVLNFMPGFGDLGRALVNHPAVDVIAFTGSRDVGLEINRNGALVPPGQDHVKRVIAEMGGKNAIIVDDDADLDEAVLGVLHSAFGYSGQKCSACSRAIVLEGVYDAFLDRLAAAVHALDVGPATDPATFVGPLINAEARDRVLRYAGLAETEGRVVARVEVGELAQQGHFVGPVIVADVAPGSKLAQEEIFGPVLAVLRARDLDEALAIANGTQYALTGGLFSRSPANIEAVRARFRVGNLYINRSITGALVDRQPFGGFKLSGIGTKAGGREYLHEFLLTRTVTENTMRHGFAPEVEGSFAAEVAPGL